MLYLYFGNDAPKVRHKAFRFVETLTEGKAPATQITSDTYVEGMITEYAQSISLFGGAEVIVIDSLSLEEEVFKEVLELVPVMAESANHFVFIERTLTAPQKKKIQTHAKNVEEITGGTKEKFNTFLLTDAYLRKDKKSLWLLLMEAWKAGEKNEAIIGVLFWQIKTLRLVSKTKSAEEAGVKPFVYSKAKGALRQFTQDELDTHSKRLLSIYHDGHRGKVDTAQALERWVLSI